MKRFAFLTTFLSIVMVLVVPFVGGGGPGLIPSVVADSAQTGPVLGAIVVAPAVVAQPRTAISSTQRVTETAFTARAEAETKASTVDGEHLAQKPVPKPVPKPVVVDGGSSGSASAVQERRAALEESGQSCPTGGGGTSGAPGASSALGVAGTTSDDLASFASQYNAIRIANCLEPVGYFFYDSCMEARLFWMAESPSPDPLDAWGHIGSTRIDGVPSVGCDGNLAGGSGNTGATVASKWWDSSSHRASLYRPGSSTGGVCIAFAMTHGGIDEPYGFTRAAARWTSC